MWRNELLIDYDIDVTLTRLGDADVEIHEQVEIRRNLGLRGLLERRGNLVPGRLLAGMHDSEANVV